MKVVYTIHKNCLESNYTYLASARCSIQLVYVLTQTATKPSLTYKPEMSIHHILDRSDLIQIVKMSYKLSNRIESMKSHVNLRKADITVYLYYNPISIYQLYIVSDRFETIYIQSETHQQTAFFSPNEKLAQKFVKGFSKGSTQSQCMRLFQLKKRDVSILLMRMLLLQR